MKIFYSCLRLLILIFFCLSAIFYFDFTAEDAYITYRYAENWVDTGSLVYNEGEPINALTSPLHAAVSATLYLLTGSTLLSNKILSMVLLSIAVLLVWHRYREHLHWQVLALILLLPPSVLLWTVGGLETPILLFLATVTVTLADRRLPFGRIFLCVIFLLTGLAFLTRYDSILFFLPVTLYAASKARSTMDVVIAMSVAAVLPLVWFIISISYYGDLLPTSFYVKTPKANLGSLYFNGIYIASYLFYTGILPVTLLGIILLVQKNRTMDVLRRHVKRFWWLYAGLLFEIVYGLTMATHHMMFSFRFFVPFIPSTVILVMDLLRRAWEATEADLPMSRPAYLFSGFLLCLALFQFYQNTYTYQHSINGASLIGEYRALGIPEYVRYIQILEQEAVDIEKHWATVEVEGGRPPRIITFAAGILPYTYRDSYIYEKLVSYRHCHQRYQQGLHADYLHILAPRQGRVDEQLPKPEDSYELVSSYKMFFDGSMQNFLVYYNPKPEEHNLSVGINDHCQQAERVVNQ